MTAIYYFLKRMLIDVIGYYIYTWIETYSGFDLNMFQWGVIKYSSMYCILI
jgi:hypothetical protein